MKLEFYKCNHCGNVIVKVADSGIAPFCCGREMQKLEPNVTDAKTEAHVPQVTRLDYNSYRVEVGSTPHPMTTEHHICFIVITTSHGWQIKNLNPTQSAVAYFMVGDDVCSIYAYCNLHGLWKCAIE